MTRRTAAAEHSIKRYIVAGMMIVVVVVFGIGGWAATATLSGAVIGQGVVVVATRVKSIQHLKGGVVRSIRVHDGDHVKAGQILAQLDPTEAQATAAIVMNTVDDLMAMKARLEAERDNLDQISFPADLKKRGFKFVGPVIVYAWMQAVGMVDDHSPECFRRQKS